MELRTSALQLHGLTIRYLMVLWLPMCQAIKELNIKPKNWKELLTDEPFTRDDLITIQVHDISSLLSHCHFTMILLGFKSFLPVINLFLCLFHQLYHSFSVYVAIAVVHIFNLSCSDG
jgi:hypothetical protein